MATTSEGQAARRRIFGRTVPQLVVWVVAAILLAVFTLENQAEVRVKFFLWAVQTRLVWALFVAGVLGFFVGAFRIKLGRR